MTLEKFQTCLLDLLSMHTRLKKDDIEKYIPQVLNSDKLNTVSYKKGCYTGQEVIARTHYLGNVKKHTYLAVVDACIDTEVNIVNKDGESVGELIGETFLSITIGFYRIAFSEIAQILKIYLSQTRIFKLLLREDIV